jgi:hypothetical protein
MFVCIYIYIHIYVYVNMYMSVSSLIYSYECIKIEASDKVNAASLTTALESPDTTAALVDSLSSNYEGIVRLVCYIVTFYHLSVYFLYLCLIGWVTLYTS